MTVLAVISEATMQVATAEVMTTGDPRRNIVGGYIPTSLQRGGLRASNETAVPYGAQPLSQAVDGTGQLWFHYYGAFRGSIVNHLQFVITTLDENGGNPANTPNSLVRFITRSNDYYHYVDITFYDDLGAATTTTINFGRWATDEHTYDVAVDFDNEQIKGYRDGILSMTVSFTKPVRTPQDYTYVSIISPTGNFASDDYGLAQMFFSTTSTVGWQIKTINPNAVGTNTEWTGTYDQIDEQNLDDADLNFTTVSGSVQTYNYEDISASIQDGKEVYGVVVSTVATAGDTSQPLVTNQYYDGATSHNVGTGLDVQDNNYTKPVSEIVTVNPATGQAWTFDEINNGEFGFKAE